jgi:hypothetical protein|tara:strand:- start:14611 stop:15159 length:549 start_codon:yes stop_codon:yes gene_type:complete
LEKKSPEKSPEKRRVYRGRAQKKRDEEFSRDAALGKTSLELASKFDISQSSIGVKRKTLARQIEKEVRSRLGTVSLRSLDNMVSLAFSSESEQVRFVATKDLLDRAGFKASEISKLEIDERRSRTPVEIEQEMRERFGNDVADMIMGRAKVINGESAGAGVSRPEGVSLASSVPVPATRDLN